ncbi:MULTISPECIES: hypothetical protein [unclassified Variovorax]|jgi:hypothetical protein|uniref:hypothetical protein n=1 Tax=unclassified Variovorax TaxID=663243 RepID=UPI000F7F9510|nr:MULTISPECIES: hypothetical protein [unclassified Variovorax]RSZ45970.1 hypothetical protein EJO70_05805 [Variovorax sp. 553]RSZ46576.1 hypothetical protein EJO71_05505 [Variovorax sp. 679]
MGLAVCVGMLAELLEDDPESAEGFEEELAEVNRVLAAAGLPQHTEPREPMEFDSRASIDGFPYSFIHYLRRAYAHRLLSPDWVATPLADDVDPTADPKIQALLDGSESHLLCHSDAEGFYVPVDFDDVLFDEECGDGEDEAEEGDADDDRGEDELVEEVGGLPGGMLGSSYRLLEELVFVAPALGIRLEDGELSDEEAQRIDDLIEEDDGLYREYVSWLLLYESARLSIEHGTAIVFC